MLETSRRPLTPEERRILEGLDRDGFLDPIDGFFRIFLCLAGAPTAGLLLAAAAGRVLERFGAGRPWILGLLGTGAAAGLIFGILRLRPRPSPPSPGPAGRDLAGGEAEVLVVEASRSVEVEESEDEGPGFYLDAGDGRILFLQGQYLYDEVEAGRFPCRRFRMTYAPNSRVVFDLRPDGEALRPERKLPALPGTGEGPEDGDILDRMP